MGFRAAGHLGLFAALYVAACVVCLGQLAGLAGASTGFLPRPAVLAAVALTALGTYALDRVKLASRWIDPADLQSQPRRYAFLRPRARAVRVMAAAALAGAGAIGSVVTPWAALAPVLAAAGVVVYAPRARARRARIKDLPLVKNLYIAAGITGLAALGAVAGAATAAHGPRAAGLGPWRSIIAAHGPALAAGAVLLGLRIIIDAALCDLDDVEADRAHGTRTLPVSLGARRVWLAAGVARALLAVATLLPPWCPWPARVVWAVVGLAGIAALRVRRPERVRDPVDVRLGVEAVVATAVLVGWAEFDALPV